MWTAILLLVQIAGLAALAGLSFKLYRRSQATQAELAQDNFDRALAADQRADHLGERLEDVEHRVPKLQAELEKLVFERRIDRARLMVLEAQAKSVLPAEAAQRLTDTLQGMDEETAEESRDRAHRS